MAMPPKSAAFCESRRISQMMLRSSQISFRRRSMRWPVQLSTEYGRRSGRERRRSFVRFLILFSIGVCATLAWQSFGDAARAMIATSWPQLASLAPEPTPAPEQTAGGPQGMAAPELQQLKEDLAQLKQQLQQLKEMPAALASLQQSVDRLAGSQQQIVGTIAKLGAQKPTSPPRPVLPQHLNP